MLTAVDPKPGAYSITGPQALSVREQIAIVNDALGRSYAIQEISPSEAAKSAFPEGTTDFVTTSVLETMGPAAAVLELSGDVRTLTGNPPRPFAAWATDNAPAFAFSE